MLRHDPCETHCLKITLSNLCPFPANATLEDLLLTFITYLVAMGATMVRESCNKPWHYQCKLCILVLHSTNHSVQFNISVDGGWLFSCSSLATKPPIVGSVVPDILQYHIHSTQYIRTTSTENVRILIIRILGGLGEIHT